MGPEALLLTLEGLTRYRWAWDLQRRLVAARQAGQIPDVLLLLEHTPVVTLGRRGTDEQLRLPREWLRRQGVEVYEIERGGGVTYHGPGQLVAYPILDLRAMDEDVVRFMRALEESIIRTVGDFGIAAARLPGYPGVWAGGAKIAAVGVAVKRRVTMHGMALNVTTPLEPFTWIDPCGLGRPVTSMARESGRAIPLREVSDTYARRFAEVYAVTLRPASREAVLARLPADGDDAGAMPAPASARPGDAP